MLVLGIDPGSQRTGWGIVEEKSGILKLVSCGIIRTTTGSSAREPFSQRMAKIFLDLYEIVSKYSPRIAAVEQIFTAQNAQSALKLGQARGAAIAACAAGGLEIHDYEPTLVKKSLTGTGRADKEQVAFMVRHSLNIHQTEWALDTSDALAVAICHLSHYRLCNLIEKAGSQASG